MACAVQRGFANPCCAALCYHLNKPQNEQCSRLPAAPNAPHTQPQQVCAWRCSHPALPSRTFFHQYQQTANNSPLQRASLPDAPPPITLPMHVFHPEFKRSAEAHCHNKEGLPGAPPPTPPTPSQLGGRRGRRRSRGPSHRPAAGSGGVEGGAGDSISAWVSEQGVVPWLGGTKECRCWLSVVGGATPSP